MCWKQKIKFSKLILCGVNFSLFSRKSVHKCYSRNKESFDNKQHSSPFNYNKLLDLVYLFVFVFYMKRCNLHFCFNRPRITNYLRLGVYTTIPVIYALANYHASIVVVCNHHCYLGDLTTRQLSYKEMKPQFELDNHLFAQEHISWADNSSRFLSLSLSHLSNAAQMGSLHKVHHQPVNIICKTDWVIISPSSHHTVYGNKLTNCGPISHNIPLASEWRTTSCSRFCSFCIRLLTTGGKVLSCANNNPNIPVSNQWEMQTSTWMNNTIESLKISTPPNQVRHGEHCTRIWNFCSVPIN